MYPYIPVENEFEEYYSTFDNQEEELLVLLEESYDALKDASSYQKKTAMYEILCRECKVHLFRESPFFFEMSSGRGRFTWGGLQSHVGSFMHEKTQDLWLNPYGKALADDRAAGFMYGWNNPVGFDHHCPGYDKVLTLGLPGIIQEAKEQLARCMDPRKQEFYQCVIRANEALIGLAGRFEQEACRLAAVAADAEEETHYLKIADAARTIQNQPPQTLYEGLCMVLFYRECVSSVEGIGISTFGQLDRMLYPYYERDLAEGRITRQEVLDMFCALLLYTDIRFDSRNTFHETSTTIEIGGTDADGAVIYNELTRIILDAVMTVRSINTKINCRISKKHPQEYLEAIARVQMADLPTVMMHNDDVIIPARVALGQKYEDACRYVGGGCHEVVLGGSEVCTRADTWLNMPRIFLSTLEKNNVYESFEQLYAAFIQDAKDYHEKIVALKNEQERHWCEYDPLILYSSSIKGSLEKGMDVTEGGAEYNSTALSMVGTATLIDSLYAVKHLVYDTGRVTYEEFKEILARNYEKDEVLRQYILRKIPKHGTNDETLNAFSTKVLADLARLSGQKNARGGDYLPAFYPHDIYRNLGFATGATPDGRLAGVSLSRGVSPSEFIEVKSPLDIIHSMQPIDFTEYADSFCTEITLPKMEDLKGGIVVLTALMKGFLEAEGSSLQFNMVSRDMLMAARKNPEQYKNLCVRVCGYSAVFTALSEEVQDEVIARAIR